MNYLKELKQARQMFLDLKANSGTAKKPIIELDLLAIEQDIQLLIKDKELIRLNPVKHLIYLNLN